MENTQLKAVSTCIIILIISSITTIIAMKNGYYALSFLGIFSAIASFAITFLFVTRASCMAKMLKGSDVIATWQYTERETIENIKESKEENKGLFVMAVPFFSLVIIVVALTVGFASDNVGMGIIISIILIVINVLFFKMLMVIEIKEKEINMKAKDRKKSYVSISGSGVYSNGMLNVWKGWGSSLKSVRYDETNRTLEFTYSYLRAYGFGSYTVKVKVPGDKLYLVDDIRNGFSAYWI